MSVSSSASRIEEKLDIDSKEAIKIIEKAIAGREIENKDDIDKWLDSRFFPNCVLIDSTGYAQMCVNALKIIGSTAATDYGSSRQRDMGQLWADMTRGYLGELAFKLFLEKRHNIVAELGHDIGKLEDYLPMDIHKVSVSGEEPRTPKLNIGIKTTKWNGIWLDIPGDQFRHSDIHVLVKVGAGRDHLFAFFKDISVFKDKVLKRGEDIGCLTKDESSTLLDSIPSFKPISAYICGYVNVSDTYPSLSYGGKKGRKHYTIKSWAGPITNGDLDKIKSREGISGNVKFEGIGNFAHDSGFLFNTGSLLWKDEDWKSVCSTL